MPMKLLKTLPYIAIGILITVASSVVVSRNYAFWQNILAANWVIGAIIGLAAAFFSAHKLVATIGAVLGGIALGVTPLIVIISLGKMDSLDRLTSQDLQTITLISGITAIIAGVLPPAIEWLARLIA
jgi:hypothetical protein